MKHTIISFVVAMFSLVLPACGPSPGQLTATAVTVVQTQAAATPVTPSFTSSPVPTNTATPTKTTVPTATPFPREFENTAASDEYLVGAYWYPWYDSDGRHWNDGYLGKPLLGRYKSADPTVINRQIDWATGHGIDFWATSWWGRSSFEDEVIRSSLLSAALRDDIQFAILYESTGQLYMNDGVFDLSNATNKQMFVSDMRYLAETFFEEPNYLHIDGRPVVFLYLTRIFVGDVAQTFQEAREAVRQVTGNEIFIIGDEVYWQAPTRSRLALFDGVTAYNMHTSVPNIAQGFAWKVTNQYQQWALAATAAGVTFVPDILPGFDDTAVRPEASHPIIPRSPELFSEQLITSLRIANGLARIVMITSWNEWHEYTSIEPSEEFGFEYLDLLQAGLRGP
jgi:glycoprotein endo-alpha-1,2-mannosidase